MAQEYLHRHIYQSGSQTTATWACWLKVHKKATTSNVVWLAAAAGSSENKIMFAANDYSRLMVYDYKSSAYRYRLYADNTFIDFSNWFHLVVVWDTTHTREDERLRIYVNGVKLNPVAYNTDTTDVRDFELGISKRGEHQYFGRNPFGGNNYNGLMSYCDAYLIDGVALNGDAFGYIKKGKGNISQGSPQKHEYTKGMWVPKPPSVVKSLVESKGGFGVNGYYLPFNGKSNPGADFHKTPDTILKLKSNLPQPLAEIDGSPTAGQFAKFTSDGIAGHSLSSSDVGLGNVENQALSTWTGSSTITSFGTISS